MSAVTVLVASAAVSAAVAATLLGLLLRYAAKRLPLDVPNARSLHERPVPRVGGVAILAGVAASVLAGLAPFGLALGLAVALAVLSFLDDLHRLLTGVRLAGHLAASAILAWYVLSPMNPLELSLIVLAIAWITNLYNFMDGIDGITGVETAVIGLGLLLLACPGACGVALDFSPPMLERLRDRFRAER